MKQIKAVIGIFALIMLAGGAFIIAAKNDAIDANTTAVLPVQHDPSTLNPGANVGVVGGVVATSGSPAPQPGMYTMADVASHNSANSCWTVIRGGVFDLTAWVNRHPGGPGAILSICGVDGTAAFDNQHEGQGRPEQILASYRIGTIQ